MLNINPETNIAYGYVSANELDSEIVDILMFGSQARNLSYQEAYQEAFKKALNDHAECEENGTISDFDENEFDEDFNDNYDNYEPIIEGTYQNVKYVSSWLGGALNFFILYSPFITENGLKASPCVPNACIIKKNMDGNTQGYTVPNDWFSEYI